jgi:signal transduction histidine kinase
MSMIRKDYLQALNEYVSSEDELALYRASKLGKMLQNVPLEEVIALHEDTMKSLIASVHADEGIRLYHTSFIFLIELMVSYRLSSGASEQNSKVVDDLRLALYKTNHSFQRVKDKYESVLQYMDSGIVIFDKEGFISFINVEMGKILETQRQHLLGCDLPRLFMHPKIPGPKRKLIYRLYKEMFVRRVPYHEIVLDGQHFLVTATYEEELDGDLLISIKDVTEFKKIEQAAYQNDKLAMLGKIAASIAHEVRNPLTAIRGFIQLLAPFLKEAGKEEYSRIILSEIDRANDIISEFLNSSKPGAPVKEEVSVASLLKEIFLLSESEALLKNCQIQCSAIDEELFVWADVKQIKQVLLNIVKNGLDAIQDNGANNEGMIRIHAERSGSFVEIGIEDTGKGMDSRTLSHLFDPFFTTKKKGTGLGLSVSYRIVKNHGGSIDVQSAIGQGTVFRIKLPLK